MPKYLVSSKYPPDAAAKVREAGYASREKAVTGLFASLGGTCESVWFTTGDWSVHIIADLPTEAAAFAADSVAWASGTSGTSERLVVRPLFTAEEADAAIAAKVDYTPPGS